MNKEAGWRSFVIDLAGLFKYGGKI